MSAGRKGETATVSSLQAKSRDETRIFESRSSGLCRSDAMALASMASISSGVAEIL